MTFWIRILEAMEDQRFKPAMTWRSLRLFLCRKEASPRHDGCRLNAKYLYRLLCLNTWASLVAQFGKVMEPLRGAALLEKMRHWGCSLRFHSSTHFLLILHFLTAGTMCPIAFCSYHRVLLAKIGCVPL